MKNKICLAVLLVILLVLMTLIDSAGVNKEDLEAFVNDGNKLYDFWKNRSNQFSIALDKLLVILELDKQSLRYWQVRNIKNGAREMDDLLKENEKMLKDILHEKDEKVLMENVLKIWDNFVKVDFRYHALWNDLAIIYGFRTEMIT